LIVELSESVKGLQPAGQSAQRRSQGCSNDSANRGRIGFGASLQSRSLCAPDLVAQLLDLAEQRDEISVYTGDNLDVPLNVVHLDPPSGPQSPDGNPTGTILDGHNVLCASVSPVPIHGRNPACAFGSTSSRLSRQPEKLIADTFGFRFMKLGDGDERSHFLRSA
jgi:hypothetical protein